MTLDQLSEFATGFDEVFFLIGAAMLAIELLKALATGQMRGRTLLDMVASASTQIPFLVVEIFLLSVVYLGFEAISASLIPWQIPMTVGTVALAILATDFLYYWEHRFAHQIRLFWTQHAVHHSSREMNILVGVRFGPFEGVMSLFFHLPLILIGFPAELVVAGFLIVLAYQTWIHTELIGKLGPLDWVLNTPANHRVHHGCDEKYIDKNYGGILIIWDRLFGTYQAEEETPNYGLKRDFSSVNPWTVWWSELPALARDVASARSFSEAWAYLTQPPGWAPNAATAKSASALRSPDGSPAGRSRG